MGLLLQLLLVLASAVIVGSESLEIHDYILLSQTADSSNLEGHVPILMYTRTRVTQLYHQVMGSIVVAFDFFSKSKSKLLYLAVLYHPSVCPGVKPLETQDQRYLYVKNALMRGCKWNKAVSKTKRKNLFVCNRNYNNL
jgi:hypothetical protein